MAVWLWVRWASKTSEGSGDLTCGKPANANRTKVKRIHVEKRENPIVNRLNKTKIEKYPDLAMEKEARQKELRKKDRDAQQARVCLTSLSLMHELRYPCPCYFPLCSALTPICRKRRKPVS